ncbi:MAG: hypothetical protein Tsb0013_18650 [Phycisphaerales bacterium]
MTTYACAAVLAVTGTALAQTPFTETFDAGNAGWQDGPGNPAPFAGGAILSQTLDNATDFFAPFPGSPALATIYRANETSSGGAFTGDYVAGGILELSFDITVLPDPAGPAGPFGLSVRIANSVSSTGVLTQDAFLLPGPNSVTLSLDLADVTVSNPGAGQTAEQILSDVRTLTFFAVQIPSVSPTAGGVGFLLDNVAIDVPAPGALSAFALAGLAGVRRRR